MPTLLDSFVMELKLDPAQFADSQKKAADAISRVEGQAARSAQNMEQSGRGVATFFRTLEAPLAGLRRHFEELATGAARPQRNLADLAAQGRRTGANVESGALAGAAGLRVLGAAGLTAFATITALDKLMGATSESAKTVFGVGVGAGAAGIPIQEFSAISQALLHKGNVPEAETQGWLAAYRSAQVQAGIGHPEQAIAMGIALSQAGVRGVNTLTTSPEEALLRIAERFHEVSADTASAYGGLIGQSSTLAQALHALGQAELAAQAAVERQHAVTQADSAAANELIVSQTNLANSSSHLTRALGDLVDGPLAAFNDWVADLRDHMANWLQGKGWVGTELPAGNPGPGATRLPGGGVEAPIRSGGMVTGGAVSDTEGFAPGYLGALQRAVYETESGSGSNYNNAPYPGHSATGPMQIIPSTFAANALPGERIDNPADNMRVGRRLLAKLYAQYGGDIDKAAYAYANGSPSSPDLNPGYTAKVRRLIAAHPEWAAGTALATGALPHLIPGGAISSQLGIVRQSAATGSTVTHNYGDTNITVGDIHTQATDGPGVMAAFKNETNWNAQASQANAGVS